MANRKGFGDNSDGSHYNKSHDFANTNSADVQAKRREQISGSDPRVFAHPLENDPKGKTIIQGIRDALYLLHSSTPSHMCDGVTRQANDEFRKAIADDFPNGTIVKGQATPNVSRVHREVQSRIPNIASEPNHVPDSNSNVQESGPVDPPSAPGIPTPEQLKAQETSAAWVTFTKDHADLIPSGLSARDVLLAKKLRTPQLFDAAAREVSEEHIRNGFQGDRPDYVDLREALLARKQELAHQKPIAPKPPIEPSTPPAPENTAAADNGQDALEQAAELRKAGEWYQGHADDLGKQIEALTTKSPIQLLGERIKKAFPGAKVEDIKSQLRIYQQGGIDALDSRLRTH